MPDIMTKADYEEYEADVNRGLIDLEFVSSGPCPGCEDCLECKTPDYPPEGWFDLAGEPHFSRSSCDVCSCSLRGDRYPVHGFEKNHKEPIHFDACVDCMYYVEYGRLDDTTMDRIEA